MTTRRRALRLAAVVGLLGIVVAGCSSGGDDASPAATTSPVRVAGPPAEGAVAVPTVQGPVTGGGGKAVLGPGGFDLASVGYQEQELFISGDATSYVADAPLTSDGRWDVSTGTSAPYTTRIVVRRPIDPAAFDGTVFVEWLNVSGGLDASPDWTYAHVELIRSGAAWVGVSAQSVGIVGGGNSLGAALALKNADPVRYAALSHPGDDYSYDMYSQAGAAVWAKPDQVLAGLTPQRVLAIGESQSAFRLSTYVDAVAPQTGVYNGYLIHSRSSKGAPLATGVEMPEPTLTRTDLDVPVLTFSSETDLVGDRLGYARARQPDTEVFRSWEVPGTAHADAYNLGIGDRDDGSGAGDAELFAAMQSPPASVYGGIITCTSPINTGPHTYVLRSAVHALDHWVRTGEAPPSTAAVELAADGSVSRDAEGNALGGIRTPQLDVPVAALSGVGQTGSSFCGLFGTTAPFTTAQLQSAQTDHEQFVTAWTGSLDDAVASGAVLEPDAQNLRKVVQASSVLR
jgi:hypothetical protein